MRYKDWHFVTPGKVIIAFDRETEFYDMNWHRHNESILHTRHIVRFKDPIDLRKVLVDKGEFKFIDIIHIENIEVAKNYFKRHAAKGS